MSNRPRLMETLSRIPVARQLAAAFALLLSMTALMGAVALASMYLEDQKAREVSTKWMAGVGHLFKARTALVDARDLEIKHSRSADSSHHSEYEDKIGVAAKQVAQSLADYKTLVNSDKEAQLVAAADKALADYNRFSKQVMTLGREKKQADAADISDGASAMGFDECMGALVTLTKFDFAGGEAAAADAQRTFQIASVALVSLLLMVLAVAVFRLG